MTAKERTGNADSLPATLPPGLTSSRRVMSSVDWPGCCVRVSGSVSTARTGAWAW